MVNPLLFNILGYFTSSYLDDANISSSMSTLCILHLTTFFLALFFGGVSIRLRTKSIKYESQTNLFLIHPILFLLVFSLTKNHHLAFTFSSGLWVSASLPYGLTGGIASGKTTAEKLLELKPGVKVIDLDKIAHEILLPTCSYGVYKSIVAAFGNYDILYADKTINRTKLGAVIFANRDLRKKLNGLTHPRIRSVMFFQMVVYKLIQNYRFVVIDAPLLYETAVMQYCTTAVIVVHCTTDNQLSRLKKRNVELNEDQCKERINSQWPMPTKVIQSDLSIDNNATFEALRTGVDLTYDKMVTNDKLFVPLLLEFWLIWFGIKAVVLVYGV